MLCIVIQVTGFYIRQWFQINWLFLLVTLISFSDRMPVWFGFLIHGNEQGISPRRKVSTRNISDTYSDPSHKSKVEWFVKNYLRKILYFRCLFLMFVWTNLWFLSISQKYRTEKSSYLAFATLFHFTPFSLSTAL